MQHSQAVPVTPSTTVTATARISTGTTREDFAGGEPVIQWLDSAYNIIGFVNSIDDGLPRGPAFKTVTTVGTAPSGASFARIAISATRDAKGRARDKVYVDNVAWDHTYAIGGGQDGVDYAVVIRVRDGLGCEAELSQTIVANPLSNGTWILFGRPAGSVSVDQYSVSSPVPSGFSGSARPAVVSGAAMNLDISGYGDGWLFAAQRGSNMIRSNDLGATWSATAFSGVSGVQQRIDVRGSRVISAQASATQYSDDYGASVSATSPNTAFHERHLFGTVEAVGGPRTGVDIVETTNNFTNRAFISGFPTWGSSRSAVNLCAGTTHLVMAGANNSPSNRFSRVPIGTPKAAHTPFTVSAVSSSSTWAAVSPSIIYGNSIFVMVTDQGQIVRSTDEGATWTVSSFTFTNPRSLAFGDGTFMIVGLAGAIYTSTDGDSWTAVSSGTFGTDNITNAIFVPS